MIPTVQGLKTINKRGRLNNRFHELEDDIKIAKVFILLIDLYTCITTANRFSWVFLMGFHGFNLLGIIRKMPIF